LSDAEIELARHAEEAYERFVSQWQRCGRAKQRTGAANEERR
jgi:transposase